MSGRIIWQAQVDCENKGEVAVVEVTHWQDEFGGHRTVDVNEADFLSVDDAEALAAKITEAVLFARDGAP